MKSIKPGRGPSAMGAFGSIVAAVFGVIWTIFAASMGAPGIFPLFGVIFIISALVGAVYNFKNASGANRMSVYDITEDNEEPDPLQELFHKKHGEAGGTVGSTVNSTINSAAGVPGNSQTGRDTVNFCPFCRCELKENFNFCPKCGSDISNI